MQKKSTDELNDLLENMRPNQLESYFKDNEKYMADEKKAFYYYMKDVLEEKNIKLKDVYSFAGVSESYGSKIFTMEKHTKGAGIRARGTAGRDRRARARAAARRDRRTRRDRRARNAAKEPGGRPAAQQRNGAASAEAGFREIAVLSCRVEHEKKTAPGQTRKT